MWLIHWRKAGLRLQLIYYISNNPINRIDPDGRWDWVKNKEGENYCDKNANDQGSTKKG
jgi:hypothetical protein